MTPDDLDAIRSRDAASLACDGPHTDPAHLDRRALLAEVDRLSSQPTTILKFGPDHPFSEVQATAEWFDIFTESVRAAERARIRVAVEGLDQHWSAYYSGDAFPTKDNALVSRAAVLAAIDGEAT
jgi:hypothetical protein